MSELTIEEELDQLRKRFSEEDFEEAEKELNALTLSQEEQKEIESELTKFKSINKMREEMEKEVKSAEIIDVGFTDELDREFEKDIYFKIKLPCTDTKFITFNRTEFGTDQSGTTFLNSIGCTVSDLSEAENQKLPITYVKYSDYWKIIVYYGDKNTIEKITQNPDKYYIANNERICKTGVSKWDKLSFTPIVTIISYQLLNIFTNPLISVLGAMIPGLLALWMAVDMIDFEKNCYLNETYFKSD